MPQTFPQVWIFSLYVFIIARYPLYLNKFVTGMDSAIDASMLIEIA